RMRSRVVGAGLGVAATAFLGVAALVAGSGPAGAAPTTLLPTGLPAGFHAGAATVPAGICFVTITADGGHGGVGSGGAAVAPGAMVSARVGVTPGQVLSIEVGGHGADAA